MRRPGATGTRSLPVLISEDQQHSRISLRRIRGTQFVGATGRSSLRRLIALLSIIVIILAPAAVFSEGESTDKQPKRSYFSFTFRGGFWMPEDSTFRKFYGRWSNDIYYMELGFYPLRNLLIGGAVGGYYQRSHTLGTESGEESGEDLTLTMIPFEVSAGYRFRFKDSQLIVPFLAGGYDWVYFHEEPDPGRFTDGWKDGFAAWGGVLILLDKADPEAAMNLRKHYGIEHTYFEMSTRYSFIGEDEGLDLRGWVYMLGLTFDF